jgi:hypothetical protein
MTKARIEYFLYTYVSNESELARLDEQIHAVCERILEEYTRYPNMSFDKIRVKGGTKDNPTLNAVTKIIDKYDKERRRLEHEKLERFEEFVKVRDAVKKLNGPDWEVFNAKYRLKLKGRDLYRKLCLSKKGYDSARARILERLESLIEEVEK